MFTDSPLTLLQAEACHRGHAIVEQVIADLKGGPLAHLPSGSFTANAAWLVCAAIAFNLTRAAGCLASTFHAKATTATLRAQLITVPGRIARSARLLLHLPTDWRWEPGWTTCSAAPCTTPSRTPDHRPARAQPETTWKSRTDRQPTTPTTDPPVHQDQLPAACKINGESRLRLRPRSGERQCRQQGMSETLKVLIEMLAHSNDPCLKD